jgi:PAS domain S-box-containing protein
MSKIIQPTGVERFFAEDEIIVSKTDIHGKMVYVNHVFLNIADYTEEEVIGKPHSMIRHPDMPRAVFKLMWETISSGKEIFAYVMNMAKNGDHYWVIAHVTPTFDSAGRITGYHSNRRVPNPESLKVIKELYGLLRTEEQRHRDPRQSLQASYDILVNILGEKQTTYEEFVFAI